jgi:hypothetical protein
MPRNLPEKCLRGLDDECEPMCQIQADDGDSFICCGLNIQRDVPQDVFTSCFKNHCSDTRYDMDEFDMLDVAEMQIRAVTTYKRGLES